MSFRGELDHFRRKSKLAVLDEAKKFDVSREITNGINQINTLLIEWIINFKTVYL